MLSRASAGQHDQGHRHVEREQVGGDRDVRGSEFLEQQRRIDHPRATPAEALREQQAREAEFPAHREHGPAQGPRLRIAGGTGGEHLRHRRRDFVAGKGATGILQQQLLVAEA